MIPGSANPLLLKSAAAGGYQIERSLRFNSSDSAYLSRTPASAGNRRIWTWAAWVKLATLSEGQNVIFSATDGTTPFAISAQSSGQLLFGNLSFAWKETTAVFRDYSAWYHFCVAVDTNQALNANRLRFYVNGVEQTAFSTNRDLYLNTDLAINGQFAHEIGRYSAGSNQYFNGYLADIHFIDGQALTPSSFTEVSATTGQLIPKAYSGSFGTNGFWLKFSDNSAATATTLGKDYSGNSNNWTPNNLSVTAGAGNDSLVDTPTSIPVTDTGVGGEVRGNYATWNPLNKGSSLTISNGNLDVSGSSWATVLSTIGLTAGMKSYMEMTVTTNSGGGFGVTINPAAQNSYSEIAGKWWVFNYSANFVIINQTLVGNYSPRVNNGDVLQLAIDYSAGKVFVGINNVWINSTNGTDGNPATGANPTFTITTSQTIFPLFTSDGMAEATNFGQRAFAYTAPSGFKALCDTNLGAPLVAKPSTVMDVKLYTGNGSTQTISGLGFSPDLVWIKCRSASVYHALFDAVRGVHKRLGSNETSAEQDQSPSGLSAFTSDGFTVVDGASGGNGINGSPGGLYAGAGAQYAAWAWDAGTSTVTNTQGSITSSVRTNASAGFSIVTYTGNATAGATVGHGLGVAPALIINKQRSGTNNWWTYHASLGATKYLVLDATNAVSTANTVWNDTAPTSTVFSIGVTGVTNTNSATYVSYCFAPVVGYSSFGSYTANNSTDGPFIYTGFRPKFILFKASSRVSNWSVLDASRNTYNVSDFVLLANTSGAETTSSSISGAYGDFLSNGFKIRGNSSDFNDTTNTYIYAAFAESPFQYARAR